MRVPAIKHEQGWKGLVLTLHKLFTDLQPTEPILVLEDDCYMVRDISYMHKAIAQLPLNFDMLLLGANLKGNVHKRHRHLYRISGAWTTHAVYYNPNFIRRITPHLPDLPIPIDEWYRRVVHPLRRSFVVAPMVAYQRPSISDIEGTHNDYTNIFEASNRQLR